MYVTRPLSQYLKSPETLSIPPDGPNSGYLVLLDEESQPTSCFGLCKHGYLPGLPFPQNKNLATRYSSGAGENQSVSHDDVALIPVVNQPLSSNQYYAIKPRGSHKGEAYASSTEEDMRTCCFCRCISDVKPRPFHPNDPYQKFEIHPYVTCLKTQGLFHATSVAPDSFPPDFLRRHGWQVYSKRPKNYELGEALGVNTALRVRFPEFNFPTFCKSSQSIVVGKWYCPFIFIKDGILKDQVKRSMYYEMTLVQHWEQIFACESTHNQGSVVSVDVEVQREFVKIAEREAFEDESNVSDGVVWFRSSAGEEGSIGLSSLIVERIKWEEERVGWSRNEKRQVRINRKEEFPGTGGWNKFGLYVLVERFVLKRMDGSVALAYDFKHTHVVRSKWE